MYVLQDMISLMKTMRSNQYWFTDTIRGGYFALPA